MKRIITLFAAAFAVTGVLAQTTNENFNSRPDADLSQVKAYLQSHCWQFHDMDINNGGWDPAIEGNGAIISGPSATPGQTTGIYSPQLQFNGSIEISFKYKLSANVTDRRWLKIYSTDGNNNIVKKAPLDSIELTGSNNTDVYTYHNILPVGASGCYKIFINYAGNGGQNRIAIDELSLGAPTCFANGCNQPPVAVDDYFGGAANRTASGDVTPNDEDPEHGPLTATLVTNSPDGNVVLESFGTFTFTPNPGFMGVSTSFTYIVCDNATLCSDPATVTITFQNQGALPVLLVDFAAMYQDDKVNLRWTSTYELNNDHYEIERSTDGINFKTVGTVKGMGDYSGRHEYTFSDDVSKNVMNKNDLYYRLKQVDKNQMSAIATKPLVVRVYRTKTLQSMSVTPNPAKNDIMVVAELNENAYAVIKVISMNGIEMMRKTTRVNIGTNKFRLEGTSTLAHGVYMLQVIVNGKENMNVKLIKD